MYAEWQKYLLLALWKGLVTSSSRLSSQSLKLCRVTGLLWKLQDLLQMEVFHHNPPLRD